MHKNPTEVFLRFLDIILSRNINLHVYMWRFFRYKHLYNKLGGGMMATIEKKKQIVEEIKTKLTESKSSVFVDYRGLNVAEITELRKRLRENNVEYKVYKNTLTRRAAEAANLEELNETLVGPTAVAFSKEDVVAPAKILHEFAKDHEALEIKGGVIEGKVATLDEIKELSTLPDYNGLVSMLLSVLQAPIRNFAYVTKAVADSREEAAE